MYQCEFKIGCISIQFDDCPRPSKNVFFVPQRRGIRSKREPTYKAIHLSGKKAHTNGKRWQSPKQVGKKPTQTERSDVSKIQTQGIQVKNDARYHSDKQRFFYSKIFLLAKSHCTSNYHAPNQMISMILDICLNSN